MIKIIYKICLLAFLISCKSAVKDGPGELDSNRIVLMPDQGKMHCNVLVREEGSKMIFALTIPETIANKDTVLLNFPETNIVWSGPNEHGEVSTSWTKEKVIGYDLTLSPGHDFVDVDMTIKNLSKDKWTDVWSFNCLSPVKAEPYKDSLMTRTFMSESGDPVTLSKTSRRIGHPKTIGVYFKEEIDMPDAYAFISEFKATSSDRTTENYLVTFSETMDSYMAATSPNALFLFNNQKFKCIHSAPNFGDILPAQSKTVTCRFYFAKGDLNDFLDRLENPKDMKN